MCVDLVNSYLNGDHYGIIADYAFAYAKTVQVSSDGKGSSEIKSSLKPKLLLTQVKGDSVFVTGDFRAFKCECDSGRWDQHDAISNIADYIYIINISSEEGIEIESGQFESNSSNVSGW
ncbi:hypothetical protein Bca52824_002817 [Brassica carinata]|uniref:Uncharacterized protein n=1 Tax=Brassica carinata TaxID=52824 RepID=A0A8X7WIT4_BRACI|nr:hypothetical protein Bca52824_002809 [Brassica carinata]KAG2331634.1 hypothetical protein Bca52824_002814 [Brassica carinata]KAG2331637.1 hypothetical protein Bca52824_002817 [Brassica carinata]